jgi:hypothetical protein
MFLPSNVPSLWRIDIVGCRESFDGAQPCRPLAHCSRPPTECYFEAMVGFTQPFFITPCDGRKLR